MILTYHNIDLNSKHVNVVNIIIFILQMLTLKILRKKIVFLKHYDMLNDNQIVLRFDDVDKKTIKYVIPILQFFKYPAEFFVCDDFIKSNDNYWANLDDLKQIVNLGFRIQYHSKSHIKLTSICDFQKLDSEIKVPEYLKTIDSQGFEYFAYPYWEYNDKILSVIKKYYEGALSGNGKSNNTIWAMDSIKILNNLWIIPQTLAAVERE